MTAAAVRHPLVFALPAAVGGAAALLLAVAPTPFAVAAVAAPLLACALVAWPWASLPVVIVGGTVASEALGLSDVTPVITVHGVLLGLGFLAVGVRRALDPAWGRRLETAADAPMIALMLVVALGSLYGLAAGHADDRVFVAAYELGVVPAYFFLATTTLSTAFRLRAACALLVVGVVLFALVGLAEAGRHGGLFPALALPAALMTATTVTGAGRRLLLAASGLFALDIVLSSYRALWLATAVALVALVAMARDRRVRRTAASVLAVGALAALAIGLADLGGLAARADLVGVELGESGGYRLSEAAIGWDAFVANPVVGQGLGQVERGVFVPDFGLTDVGPVYHAFYVTVLANAGLVGLACLLWALAAAVRHVRASGSVRALAFGATLLGFAVSAAFAGPTDGHWELGVLAALTVLAARLERPEVMR